MKTGTPTVFISERNGIPPQEGAGFTGNYGNRLYFQGLLIQAEDYKYQTAVIDGHTFIVNRSGSIQKNNTEYKEDGDILIDAKRRTEGGTDTYRIEFVTEKSQWRYSIDENASLGTLKTYVEPVDITKVMNLEE